MWSPAPKNCWLFMSGLRVCSRGANNAPGRCCTCVGNCRTWSARPLSRSSWRCSDQRPTPSARPNVLRQRGKTRTLRNRLARSGYPVCDQLLEHAVQVMFRRVEFSKGFLMLVQACAFIAEGYEAHELEVFQQGRA